MYTPWGSADHQERVSKDGEVIFYSVSTPSHGGMGITTTQAAKLLSPEAIEAGEHGAGGMLWYEEDCAWCILAWELGAEYWPFFFQYMKEPNPTKYLLDSIRFWSPVYAAKHGLLDHPQQEGQRFFHGRCCGQYQEDPTYHLDEAAYWTCSNCGMKF